MVRYSKLEFRTLVRKYGCQLCFTPMIMADSFISSEKARQNEFKTNLDDRPLIVQFGANSVNDFLDAAELVSPFCDGVDLNCGCPQRWAMKAGYGANLLSRPHLIHDMIRQLKNRIPNRFSISVKMRLKERLSFSETIELCRDIEAAGASFLTVHGRTLKQRKEPVDYDAIRHIAQSVQIPVIANGDVKSYLDVDKIIKLTECKGVMCARSILQNPALYACERVTPTCCVQEWVNICVRSQTPFQCFHHHLVFMLEKVLPKAKRRIFNQLTNIPDVIDFLSQHLNIVPPDLNELKITQSEILYKNIKCDDGSYFKSKIEEDNSSHISEDYLEDSCLTFL
ncbi:hypothetical protein AAG570_012354 [Ranatra chinensis]|uniref:DUS-like FMN-binding domain-containing protein n=1 Tax=Ranatra chinensis TaxID=642074 RepID=A0ABD0YIQ1_9HEMI